MRKLLSLILLTALMLTSYAKPVNEHTAMQVAQNFWKAMNGNGTLQIIEQPFSHVYLFSNDINTGFVLVAGDDVATPILGYSTNNGVCMPMADGAKYWISIFDKQIAEAEKSGIKATEENTNQWNQWMDGTAVGPQNAVANLVQTTWDQDPLYNNLCPFDQNANERTVTGCVATAMAQVLKYHNHPAHGVGSHSYACTNHGVLTADFAHTQYDWNNMPTALTNSSTQQQKNAVATLMYHCGVAIDMTYDISSRGGSGAYTQAYYPYLPSAETALKTYFGYEPTLNHKDRANYSLQNWQNLLKGDLDNSRPIIYHGRDEAGGHCFVCDGYNDNNQFHFNWGWSGYYDGYYAIDALNPGAGGTGGNSTYTFNQNQGAILGITPSSNVPESPCNNDNTCILTVELSSEDDGWGGAAIQFSNEDGYIYDKLCLANGSTGTSQVYVCDGTVNIDFLVASGYNSYTYMCGFVIKDAEGTTIYSHRPNTNLFNGPLTTTTTPCGAQVTCDRPTNVEANSDPNSATITWNGNASSYYIEYGASGFIRGNGTSATTNATTYTIEGLNNSTEYDVYVAAICPDDSKAYAPVVTFVTGCSIRTTPWSDSFESEQNCWTFVDADNDDDNWTLYNGTQYARTGDLFIASASWDQTRGAYTPDNWAISPAIAIPEDEIYKLDWYDRALDANVLGDFYTVYVSTTGTNISDFTEVIYQGTTTSGDYQHRMASLEAFSGNTIHIAFRHHNCNDKYMLLIDDISISEANPCPAPTNLVSNNITSTSATISWQGSSNSYTVEYGPMGFILGNGEVEHVTTNSLALTDLTPGTQYQFYVTNNCSDGTPARSIYPGMFTTTAAVSVRLLATGNTNGFMGTLADNTYTNRVGETIYHNIGETADYYILSFNPQGSQSSYGGRLVALKVDDTELNMNNYLVSSNYDQGGYAVYKYTFVNINANHVIEGQFTNTPLVGIDNVISKDVILFPNPSTSVINIIGENIQTIEVFDIMGRKVISTDYTQTLNIEQLAIGFYTIRLTTPKGIITKKFEKR